MESRFTQAGCSCSYSSMPGVMLRHDAAASCFKAWRSSRHNQPVTWQHHLLDQHSNSLRTCTTTHADLYGKGVATGDPHWGAGEGGQPGPRPKINRSDVSRDNRDNISGYTPAQYITYSDKAEHTCRLESSITVDAPPSLCFDLWDDWCRLVDFLDLVGQIGLDPKSPTMGLFQCFYRWGQLPVLEVVFLLSKSILEDEGLGPTIKFSSVWGCPLEGEVSFMPASANGPPSPLASSSSSSSTGTKPTATAAGVAAGSGPAQRVQASQTTLRLRLRHQLPNVLVDTVNVGAFAVETHMSQILRENLADFKLLAEAVAQGRAPSRQEPQAQQQMPVFVLSQDPEQGNPYAPAPLPAAAHPQQLRNQAQKEGRQQQQSKSTAGVGEDQQVRTAAESQSPAQDGANASGNGSRAPSRPPSAVAAETETKADTPPAGAAAAAPRKSSSKAPARRKAAAAEPEGPIVRSARTARATTVVAPKRGRKAKQ